MLVPCEGRAGRDPLPARSAGRDESIRLRRDRAPVDPHAVSQAKHRLAEIASHHVDAERKRQVGVSLPGLAEVQHLHEPQALVRRLFLDLTGLPPSPEERAAFLEAFAQSPDAVERLVQCFLINHDIGMCGARPMPWVV